jgi:hypothetical protein
LNVQTGEVLLFCEEIGMARVSAIGPNIGVPPYTARHWAATVRFGGENYQWLCPQGLYDVGQTVKVRRTARGHLVAA